MRLRSLSHEERQDTWRVMSHFRDGVTKTRGGGTLLLAARSDLKATETSSDEPSLSRDDLLALCAAERVHRIQAYVLQQFVAALRLAPDQARGLHAEQSLLSQGMDSLTATNLAGRIQQSLGVTLRLEDLLLGASAAQVAIKIAELVGEMENEEEIMI